MDQNRNRLQPYISPLGAWALSLGTTIGWGSLVVTSNTYLNLAGPAGSIAGLIIGAVAMLIIGKNYHYMINCFPDAGGAYSYAKETFGYDYGFLVSWFLSLTYVAILWANTTSLPLFARYFMGDIFRFGKMYTIFGYDVYAGEVLLTFGAIALLALLCTRSRGLTIRIMSAFALLLTACITICFIAAMTGHGGTAFSYEPGFVPDKSSLSQIIHIACISPWAFIGFENISHSAEEFSFPRSRSFRIMGLAILTGTLLYIFILLLSVSAYPPQYSSWLEYIRDHGNLSGIDGLPAFYAAQHYLGNTGVMLLMAALLGLIITSLIGNTIALSRLLFSLAKDNVLPESFSALDRKHNPVKAILLIVAVTLPIPFMGRTAIGWIVDVTTIGATLIYGFVSASSFKIAKVRGDRTERLTGATGIILMTITAAYLLLPNLFSAGSMEKETFFLFVVWGILGFIFFRFILRRDKENRFGKSLIVWIALLSLVLLIALIWMSQSMMTSTTKAMNNIHEYYVDSGDDMAEAHSEDEIFINEQMSELRAANTRTVLGATAMFAFALLILLTNYTYMNRKALESEAMLGHVRDMANTDPLTGVKSKHAFAEHEKALDEEIAGGTAGDFSVVVCDVNGLKHVNDTYGHKAGDEYIKSASRMICEAYQHSPVFRTGGDEFVVFLKGRDHEQRLEILEDFNRRAEANIGTDEVVISAGMADYEQGSDKSIHTVFERADSLMYERKQQLKSMGARTR